MNSIRFFVFFLFAFTTTFVNLVEANPKNQTLNPLRVVEVHMPRQVALGDNAEIHLKLALDPEFIAYTDQFKVSLEDPSMGYLGEPLINPTFKWNDKYTKKIKSGVKDQFIIKVALEVSEKLKLGDHSLKLNLRYQACNPKFCLFPKSIKLSTHFEATKDRFAQLNTEETNNLLASNSQGLNKLEAFFKKSLNGSVWITLIIVFLAGILTSFTPCVLPMIPITISVLGNQTKTSKGFLSSLIYVLGIATTYSLFGIIAAQTGQLFSFVLQNPYFVWGIFLFFVILSLSMYGYLQISWATGWLKQEKFQGRLGLYITGLVAGLVASPCVGPVLIAILAYVSQSQNTFYGFLLLFVYALGLGQLFILMGTSQKLFKKIPRSGFFMKVTQFLFGSIILTMGFVYLEPIVSKSVLVILISLTLVIASFLLGILKPIINLPLKKVQKTLSVIVLVLGLLNLILIKEDLSVKTKQGPQVQWEVYSEDLLTSYLSKKQPVILDIYADWCVACADIEEQIINTKELEKYHSQIKWIKLDATQNSPHFKKIKKTYGVLSLPHIIFFKDGKIKPRLTLKSLTSIEDFENRLRDILN